jgi:phosphoribosylaminoimidazolecarboxamide formyltransferase / IMP cyclohydrolase
MRALLSAYDKTGLSSFARGLAGLGWDLVASGGTAAHLEGEGLTVTRVEELTGFGEMLGHRVVTLHPAVHGGILARRDVLSDLDELTDGGYVLFDLVYVNLYPFAQTIAAPDATYADGIEKIDVGGPALLRAAAKNHAHVVPLCRGDDLEPVLDGLRGAQGVSVERRRLLAARAFATTAAYDAAVAEWLAEEDLPELLLPAFDRSIELSYGENPHQRAAYYVQCGARSHLLSRIEQRGGKALSYNNLNDLAAARLLAHNLGDGPVCVIVKHANPCGVAVADTIDDAYAKALAADPLSAYGGVVVLTRPVSELLAGELAKQFVEVLLAPGFDAGALAVLSAKPAMRLLDDLERRAFEPGTIDYRRVPGGLLVQERDARPDSRAEMDVVCGAVDAATWDDLLFAWTVVRHVTSNAIVLARGGQTLGVGAGQMSRVDAVRLAVDKAREHGHSLTGSVLASDAFFPFADGVRLALDAGVVAIIQPGGSKRDDEVMAAVDSAAAAMVVTGRRHFRH